MQNKISWEEMKREFPNEWLLIVDFDIDSMGHLKAGVVERHSKEMDEICRPPVMKRATAFRYTGESTFAGLRSHVQNYHLI